MTEIDGLIYNKNNELMDYNIIKISSMEEIIMNPFCKKIAVDNNGTPCVDFMRISGPSKFVFSPSFKNIPDRFMRRTSLKEITLPNNLESIGRQAFELNDNLKYIIFPDGLKKIGPEAFRNCYSLEKVHIPDSVETLSPGIFFECHKLKEAEISGAKTIETAAFRNTGLEKVKLNKGLLTIEEFAFGYCEKLTEIHLPSTVCYCDQLAFEGCYSIKIKVHKSTIQSNSWMASDPRIEIYKPSLEELLAKNKSISEINQTFKENENDR